MSHHIAAIPARDPERDALIVASVPLAQRLAAGFIRRRRWRNRDAVSDALWGLVEATRTYDPKWNGSFSNYAGHRILGAMIDGMRETRALSECGTPFQFVRFRDGWIEHQPPRGPDSFGFVAQSEEGRDVQVALGKLNARQRRAVTGRCFDDLTSGDIASEFGVTPGRASQIYLRAIKMLREDPMVSRHR